VSRLVAEAHERALGLLRTNRTALDAIATALLHEESLDRSQFEAIAREHGARPLPPSAADRQIGTDGRTPERAVEQAIEKIGGTPGSS
jgi:hypothetical protein